MNVTISIFPFLSPQRGVAVSAAVLIGASVLATGCALPPPVQGETPTKPLPQQHAAARDVTPSLSVYAAPETTVKPAADPAPTPPATLETYCWSIRTDFYHGPCDEVPVFILTAKYWVPSRPGSTVVRVEGPSSDAVVAKALAKVMADVNSLEPWERALVAR